MFVSFKSIQEEDLEFLKEVYRSTREEELSLTGWTEEEKVDFIDFQFNAQHNYYHNTYVDAEFLIIHFENKRAGRLYIWRTNDQIRIIDIALLPAFRGRGIGTKILSDLIEESEQKSKKLNIHVEYYNPALRFYERLGFKKTDDTGVYYFMERQPE